MACRTMTLAHLALLDAANAKFGAIGVIIAARQDIASGAEARMSDAGQH